MPYLLFFIPFIKSTLNLCSAVEGRALFFAICLPILFLNLGIRKSNKKFNFKTIDCLYVAFVLICVVSFFLTNHNTADFHSLFLITAMFFVYLYFRIVLLENKRERMLNIIILIIATTALIGLYQFVLGKRIIGTFYGENFFGCYLAINVPIIFAFFLMLLNKKNYLKSISAFVILTLVFGVLILTKSRTAIIGSGVSTIIILIYYFRKYIKIYFFVLILPLASVVGYYLYNLKPLSALGRLLIWKIAINVFLINPISGVGFGNFKNYFNIEQAAYFINNNGTTIERITAGTLPTAFNMPLEVAAELGILGLTVFGMFWWLILKEVYKIFFLAKARRK